MLQICNKKIKYKQYCSKYRFFIVFYVFYNTI
nr:MAG TPA: hypothetical protein [Caudoviricetes sp.]